MAHRGFWTHSNCSFFRAMPKSGRKCSTKNAEVESFLPLVMFDLTLVCGSEFEFFSRGMRLKEQDFSKRTIFLKKVVFPQNFYDFCQCRSFCHIMDSWQTDLNNYSRERLFSCQIYAENLHCQRILTVGLPTVYLVNKIQFRLHLYFDFFDLENSKLGS